MLLLNPTGTQPQATTELCDVPGAISVLAGDTDPASVDEEMLAAPLIEIRFPAFNDGRGFSLARYLRLNKNYRGVLRATGGLLPDQLSSIFQLGFDEVLIDDQVLGKHGKEDWLNAQVQSAAANYLEMGADKSRSIWQRRTQN